MAPGQHRPINRGFAPASRPPAKRPKNKIFQMVFVISRSFRRSTRPMARRGISATWTTRAGASPAGSRRAQCSRIAFKSSAGTAGYRRPHLLDAERIRHPECHRKAHAGIAHQRGLHGVRADLVAAEVDDVLLASADDHHAVFGHAADVARIKPSVAEEHLRPGRIADITIDATRSAKPQQSFLAGRERAAVVVGRLHDHARRDVSDGAGNLRHWCAGAAATGLPSVAP